MADKPIIFSAQMIRGLLDGRKTQTRRVLKPQPECVCPIWKGRELPQVCFFPGDRLWVREAFVRYYDLDDNDMRVGPLKTAYRADGGFRWLDVDTDTFRDSPPWKPSIHMPRWASRLTLIVTDVRVQRLQEISAADAVAEGCYFKRWINGEYPEFDVGVDEDNRRLVAQFKKLWNDLHGPDAWDANPWVCALTFTVHRCNIDQMGAE